MKRECNHLLFYVCLMLAVTPLSGAEYRPDEWPSDGPPGVLAAGWKETNKRSSDPLSTGIGESPVRIYSSSVSHDGRPVVVMEMAMGSLKGIPTGLHVRAFDGKKWQPLVESKPLGGEGRMRHWKELEFPVSTSSFGLIATRWIGDRLVIACLEDVRIHGKKKRAVKAYTVHNGQWADEKQYILDLPGTNSSSAFDTYAGSASLHIDKSGNVWLVEPRTLFVEPGSDIAADHPALFKGQLRLESLWIQKLDSETGQWKSCSYVAPASSIRGRAAFSGHRFLLGPQGEALIAIQPGNQKTELFQWKEDGWQPYVSVDLKYGLPIGINPAGRPVFLLEIKEEHRIIKEFRYAELDEKLEGFQETVLPLPTSIICYNRLHMEWFDNVPYIAMVRNGIPERQRKNRTHLYCVEVLFRKADGEWKVLSKKGESPYVRPPHGNHDAVNNPSVVRGSEHTLLLWQSAMPIHGPWTTSGAYWNNK